MNPETIKTLNAGDELEITYLSTQDGLLDDPRTLVSEVVDVELRETRGRLFGTITLAEYRDEDDTLPRRRLTVRADSVDELEARRTTKQGAKWQDISQSFNFDVEVR